MIIKEKFFIINPDSETYTEDEALEVLQELAKNHDIKLTETGAIRDHGHGLERKFILECTEEKSIQDFIEEVETELKI